MTELRAPDPTLTAYWREEGEGVDVAVTNPYVDRAKAHRITGRFTTACGREWDYTHPAFAARWFTVPCRRCFPKAPPPGHSHWCCGYPSTECRPRAKVSDHLAWQTERSNP